MLKVLCNKIKQDSDTSNDLSTVVVSSASSLETPIIETTGAKKRKSISTTTATTTTPNDESVEPSSSLSALCFIAEVVDSNTSGKVVGASSKQSSMAYSVGNPGRRRSRAATITSFMPTGSEEKSGRSRSGSTVSGEDGDAIVKEQEKERNVKRRVLNSGMQSNAGGGRYEGEEDVAALLASLSNQTNMDLNSPVRNRSNSMINSSSLVEKSKSARKAAANAVQTSSMLAREGLSRTTVTSAAKFAGSTITFPRQNSDYVRKQSVSKGSSNTGGTGNTGTSSLSRHFKDVSLDQELKCVERGPKPVRNSSVAGQKADSEACASTVSADDCSSPSNPCSSVGSGSCSDSEDRDGSPNTTLSDGSAISPETDEADDDEDKYYYRQICTTFSNNGSFFSASDAKCTEDYISKLSGRESVTSVGDSAMSNMSLSDNITCLADAAAANQSMDAAAGNTTVDCGDVNDSVTAGVGMSVCIDVPTSEDGIQAGIISASADATGLNQAFLTDVLNSTVCLDAQGDDEGSEEEEEDNCGFAASDIYATATPEASENSFGNVDADSSVSFIGAYSPDERYKRLIKFFSKRNRRVWTKRVKYDVRKNFADSRVRVKGRFVKKEDEEFLMKEHIEVTAKVGGDVSDAPEGVESKNSTAEALMSLISS